MGGPFRPLAPGQVSQVVTIHRDGSGLCVVHEADYLLEAPNWSPDGAALILNGGGRLFRLALGGGDPVEIVVDGVTTANNDHVLSPDGQTIYLTADATIYSVPVAGGMPKRVSPPNAPRLYLHGISPDGGTLSCTGIDHEDPDAPWGLYLLSVKGGSVSRIIAGAHPMDGPDFSPDGRDILFNAELDAPRAGAARLYRIPNGGGRPESLTDGSRVDWFPHPSPDGAWIAYLSYPHGTVGHPSDHDVLLRIIPAQGGAPSDVCGFFGGQGSLNVPSWSPDSRQLAFVAYPIREV